MCPHSFASYSRYHLKDVIVGKIYFLLVRIKLKYMELAIVKKEMAGTGTTTGTGTTRHAAKPTYCSCRVHVMLFWHWFSSP